ncbi:hypothetical protein KEM60_02271 [Austwickia sp. TVS 96-490-7B]|uniref:hypothetical protein n=1 Tax=Austwickia sp. TVS 96-490-7B TaxID=2830843 RepID=UPI001C59D16C|nr:hypothetical protein [Austwickia sp. TVS 96-490-7B]MBW3086060.1 hypothetical protein [Austwickia sp. TVS 96-490-7B]
MGRAHQIRTMVMLLLLSCLAVTLGAYLDRQQMARLEGNRLYSSAAVAASVHPRQALTLIRKLGGANRAFIDMDENGPARMVTVGDPRAFRFPSADGSHFNQGPSPQAVVGASAQTAISSGQRVVKTEGREVPIVGMLGSRSDSLLAYDVLVVDDDIFAKAPLGVVTFDGPDAAQAARAAFGDAVMPVGAGVADRTNVDVISPVLVRLCGGALALGSLLSGVIIASYVRRWLEVSYVLGQSRAALFSAVSAQFALVASPAVLIALGLGWFAALPGGPAVPGAWFMVGALAAGFTATHVSIWRWRPWN